MIVETERVVRKCIDTQVCIFLIDESEGYIVKSYAAFVLRKIGGKRPVQSPRRLSGHDARTPMLLVDL